MDDYAEIAALWGSAENLAYPAEDRVKYALAALNKMSLHLPGWNED